MNFTLIKIKHVHAHYMTIRPKDDFGGILFSLLNKSVFNCAKMGDFE